MRTHLTEFYSLLLTRDLHFCELKILAQKAKALPPTLAQLVVSFLRPPPVTGFGDEFQIAAIAGDGEPARICSLLV